MTTAPPDAALADLAVPPPPGRTVTGPDGHPLPWAGDRAVPIGPWERPHRAHPETGLWPLLLSPLHEDDDDGFRPWLTGELRPDGDGRAHDAQALLARWRHPDGAGGTDHAPAPGHADTGAADARDLAAETEAVRPVRLGLVAAPDGAAALAACGWTGAANRRTTGEVAAVLAHWQHRLGVRLVEAGFDTLRLSVPHPPASTREALPPAGQVAALCPDLLHQGDGTLTALARQPAGARSWTLWWD
ncbi:DUF4253 domain-containing protein [Kitasatospora sp. NPDC101183]|uniref:DUF4253 domain-containing protein n=1 Tax=Kitasatospora sp. NPDC101183 TaxID=3364100 RepID=UPI00381F6798